MSEATLLISAIEEGDSQAARQLFPLVYQDLRAVAAMWLAQEQPGHTLQPTGLVHEAYLRLIDTLHPQKFSGHQHFFAVAVESMRRILVDHARRRNALKRGGGRERESLDSNLIAHAAHVKSDDELIALDTALSKLALMYPRKAELVKLRFFAGLTLGQASELMGISHNTADRWWAFARGYLLAEIPKQNGDD